MNEQSSGMHDLLIALTSWEYSLNIQGRSYPRALEGLLETFEFHLHPSHTCQSHRIRQYDRSVPPIFTDIQIKRSDKDGKRLSVAFQDLTKGEPSRR